MISQLAEDLKRDESWSATAYPDHLGFWTIGYGFLVDSRKGVGLPLEIGEAWLEYAIAERWDEFCRLEPWVNDQPDYIQRALGNMCYQLGVEGLRGFEKMLGHLMAGDRREAAREALNSRWARQTPNRARRVAALLRGE